MSTYVVGFRPADKAWKRHKAVWDACELAKVTVPAETESFFDGADPSNPGAEVKLGKACCYEYSCDSQSGYEVDIEKLPKGVKIIRFINSW